MAIPKPTIEQRMAKILVTKIKYLDNGCWEFTGYTKRGYGYIMHDRKNYLAHRFSYLAFKSELPDLTLDHTCNNRACINPQHLEPTTLLENQMRSPRSNVSKTHCKRGHEFTPDNTVKVPGGKACKTCRRATWRKWYVNSRQTTTAS